MSFESIVALIVAGLGLLTAIVGLLTKLVTSRQEVIHRYAHEPSSSAQYRSSVIWIGVGILLLGVGILMVISKRKNLPSLSVPDDGYQKYQEIQIPLDAGAAVRWHKEDPRKVSFPVYTDIRWYLIHDEAPNGEWIRVNTDNPTVWRVEMSGGRFEYTYRSNLRGVKVGYVDTGRQERTERLEMVQR